MRAVIHMRRLSCLVTLAAVAACGADKSAQPSLYTGLYVLASVDGHDLPATISPFSDPSHIDQILGGNGSVNSDGTFALAVSARDSVFGRDVRDVVQYGGTWTASGSTITFTPTSCVGCTVIQTVSASLTGTATGSAITIDMPFAGSDFVLLVPHTYTFQRQ